MCIVVLKYMYGIILHYLRSVSLKYMSKVVSKICTLFYSSTYMALISIICTLFYSSTCPQLLVQNTCTILHWYSIESIGALRLSGRVLDSG